MRRIVFSLVAAGALVLSASAVQAQATRTWVSGVGDDANPCSRTAPCKTFAGAISKTAAGGEISVLDPGGFGVVTITKAISITAEGVEGGILAAGTTGIIVNAGVNDTVNLHGLIIEGAGTGLNGIRFLAGKALHIQNCVIRGFNATGAGSGNGIVFAPNSLGSTLSVRDTTINSTFAGGVLAQPAVGGSAKVLLDHVHADGTSGFGFKADATNGAVVATLRESSFVGNSGAGIHGFSPGANIASVFVDHSASVSNGTGILADTGTGVTIRITDVSVTGNSTGMSITGSARISSFSNNHNNGNGTEGAPSVALPLQ
jgi:hypothetical protein